jgi:hypothetical protein
MATIFSYHMYMLKFLFSQKLLTMNSNVLLHHNLLEKKRNLLQASNRKLIGEYGTRTGAFIAKWLLDATMKAVLITLPIDSPISQILDSSDCEFMQT